MLPKINGKSFLDCTEEDLKILIDNHDFRENEFIDYKQNFAFLEMPKGKDRNEKIAEFKSDVCSFANADGGYLIFGISDVDGCASELLGIEIDNTDKFELDRRNNLTSIQPKIPYLSFHFVKLENGRFIVVIYVKHDSFAPYTHIEDEKNYKIYKRVGNRKQTLTYTELKNMFNQSISLDKEIFNYRMDRINYYRSQEDDEKHTYSQFLMLHIIPETFTDLTYNQNMLILEKNNGIQFSKMFSDFSCSNYSIPCVDGLRFIPYSKLSPATECFVYNDGIVECFFPLRDCLNIGMEKYPEGYIAWKYIWDKICGTVCKYNETFMQLYSNIKVFVCISIIGCKGVASTGENESFWYDYVGKIDRNTILCTPVPLDNVASKEEEEILLKKLYIEYLISIGKKHDEYLDKFIKDIYHS